MVPSFLSEWYLARRSWKLDQTSVRQVLVTWDSDVLYDGGDESFPAGPA